MTSYWIFQANPDRFDIDGAVRSLDQIVWRTPQYAASIAPGDGVIIWRSGSEAGVVGVGRVLDYPAERSVPATEQQFEIGEMEHDRTTRVNLAVRRAEFQSKSDVAALPGWGEHQIITAPMGTVFQISDAEWAATEAVLPRLPDPPDASAIAIPPAFSWEQRRKDVYPLPGGYGGYLKSLTTIFNEVAVAQPTRTSLNEWMQSTLGVTETSARMSLGFLIRVGLLHESAGTIELSTLAETWRVQQDHALLIGLLHSRTRFIGELLAEATEPRTDSELLSAANDYYEAGWQTRTQIRRRRGWLESAGFLAETGDGLLQTTPAGQELVARLDLRERGARHIDPEPATVTPTDSATSVPATTESLTTTDSPVSTLIGRLHETGNDGAQADAFERETAEAFSRLGFRATWLGKSGRTDVLLEADLGRDHGYRVIVDCKSTGRGTVSQQIDWDTIDEHRKQHAADYAIIVAPGFGGGKLVDRASRHDTVLLTIDDLSELLVQHERVPLSLDAYRELFGGDTVEEGLATIGELAIGAERRIELVETVLDLLAQHGPRMGPMTARDFDLLLTTRDDLLEATEVEIDDILVALSAPLFGILERDTTGAVRFASMSSTAVATLRIIAERIGVAVSEVTPE